MAEKTKVEPSKVREWLQGEAGQKAIAAYNAKAEPKDQVTTYVGPRGQFQPVHRALFDKAHPGKTYVVGAFKEPLRTFKHKALDKRGRNRTATVKMTLAEARALINDTGKGRLDEAAVVAALEAKAGIAPPVVETPKVETSVEKD